MTHAYVHAVGMATPVGLRAASACAAMRAGIDQRFEMEYLDNRGEGIMGSFLERLGWDRTRRERWLMLLAYALTDLALSRGKAILQLPMIVTVPADTRGGLATPEELAAALDPLLATALDPRRIFVIDGGSVGGLWALSEARRWLRTWGDGMVLVGGADSFIEARVLARIAREGRLLSEDNADGFTPGEAAACLLIGASRKGSLAAILGLGFGDEPGRLDNDVPLRSEGLADAARQALQEAGLGMHELDFRLSDATGEAYWFKEQVLVISKLLRHNMQAFPLWLAATTLGHVGCAAALVNAVTAIDAWQRGRAPGRRAIVYGSGNAGERGALVLESTMTG